MDAEFSIVDILLGRHQHEPVMKITASQRLYCNYRFDDVALKAELETAGRHRNRKELEDPANPVAQTLKSRGY